MSGSLENIIDKVLIVDDNQQNLALMQAALKKQQVDIYTAQSGTVALEILQKEKFSLIIMDVNMPLLTGFETVKIFQQTQSANDTPIIFISSQCKSDADIEEGFKVGAYDYILRPIDIPLFRNKVKTFLRLYRTEQQLKQQLAEQVKINNELKFSEQVFENSVNGIIIVDENLRFVRVNRAFSEITGYSPSELIGKTPKILASGVQDKAFYDEMWHTLINIGSWQGELWNKRKGSELYAEMLSINAVKDKQGVVSNYIGIVTDITEKKLRHEKNEHLANYDYLTDLPNRLNLMNTVEKNIADDSVKTMAILFLDLDQFKPVNDEYGHQMGDDLLVAVAKRLRSCVRESDFVARLGGDEFIVVLKGPNASVKASEKVAKKIISAISSPFNIARQQVTINTSIGITLYPQHAINADSLITLADIAMYNSKDAGAGCFHFYKDN